MSNTLIPMKEPKIRVQLVRNDFTEQTREEMWQLYRHYYHYSREAFMQRIHKNNYYSLYTCGGRLVGFTGLRIHRMRSHSGRKLLIYYGQTVIDSAYRGQSLIPRTGAQLCMRFAWDLMTSRVFFWADCLTYKAYLVFAKTVDEYYPSYRQTNPREVQEIIDRIGMMNYHDTYCPETGTVRKDKVLVNDTTLLIPPEDAADPDISFFQQANPKYREGHGLITLTPMNKRNVFKLFNRFIRGKAPKTQNVVARGTNRHSTQTSQAVCRPESTGGKSERSL